MGSEALCRVRFGDQVSQGKALLETAELLFRGDFRLTIPFRDITSLASKDGELRVGFGDGMAVFELGRDAATWANKIRNPRGRLEKLGVQAGARVSVLGIEDAGFLEELRGRTARVSDGRIEAGADFVFYEADAVDDLGRLSELRSVIAKNGAVWVVSPKGKAARIKDTDVMAAAKEAGLVDTKVVAFSETHTALKLVIPIARR